MFGRLNVWIKNYGFVSSKVGDAGETFFVHRSSFLPGHEPILGGFVEFEVSSLKVVDGKYRPAIKVRNVEVAQ
jgi:hypothetical protein